VDESEIS